MADEPVASNESAAIQRQPNRKNVGIIDTIARLQQSISSAGTSNSVDGGVEKLPDHVSQSRDDKASIKDEANCETTSMVSERQIDPDTSFTQSEDEVKNAVKSIDGTKPNDDEKKVVLTYETIVCEAMQIDGENGSDNVKKCVSQRRSSGNNSYSSLSYRETGQPASHLGSRDLGGSSSNADSTKNDVDMVDVENKPKKILTRIDNIGYTRYTSDSSVSFCCLIDDCGFESVDLTQLLYHIDDHPVEWFGYCFTCDAQIETEQVQLMMEFKHMTSAHYNKNDDSESMDKANTSGKPALIKCKVLPGDMLSTLKEEEEMAAKAAKQMIIEPSTSSAVKVETNFLKIANVTSLTSNLKTLTTAVKPETVPPRKMIISKSSASQESSDSVVVSLKPWLDNPTNKLHKNCKKMLRDICLYALYKCMDVNCSFTTDNADHMLIHLRNHENNVSCEPRWLECAYCDIVADSCTLLVKHIQDEHQSSIFQCPYCFYRSCAAYNIVVHLKQFHSSETKSVLVCNGKTRLYQTEKAFIEKSRAENIRPLRCTEGNFSTPTTSIIFDFERKKNQNFPFTDCNKITYAMDHFVTHMKSSPDHSDDKFKCQFCGYNTLISETSKHLLVHSVGVYECVYCHYGINDLESIQNHMCNTHPSKLLYICVRLTRKDRTLVSDFFSIILNLNCKLYSVIVSLIYLDRRTIELGGVNIDLSSRRTGRY